MVRRPFLALGFNYLVLVWLGRHGSSHADTLPPASNRRFRDHQGDTAMSIEEVLPLILNDGINYLLLFVGACVVIYFWNNRAHTM